MEELRRRKTMRLKNFDYNEAGAYFITICTSERRNILSRIVGTGVPDGPQLELSDYGKIADRYIKQLNDFYEDISVDSYVIMPNHIHLLISVKKREGGPSGTPVPTRQNNVISQFISTLKRFSNKEYGINIWQYRSYDHVIRDKEDYEARLKYIRENPICWYFDELYSEK